MRIVLCDSETINSYGFKTDVKGINLSRFEKNPVMLYQHNPHMVIGRWEDIKIEDGQLSATPVFDMEDPEAAEIARKVEQGFIKGCSMGIVIKQMTRTKGIDTATESVLLEASIVSIPADENALVVYDSEDKQNQLSINDFNKLFYIMEKKEKPELQPDNSEIALSQRNMELQAQVDEQSETIKALNAKIDELQRDLAERDYREAEAFVDKAIADGKITEEVKSEALSFYLSFPKETEKLFANIKGVEADEQSALQQSSISLSEMVNQKAEPSQTWDELDRAGKLRNLKANNPEEFKRLYKEKFHKEWE
jgi:HK97 family phage prohead protease